MATISTGQEDQEQEEEKLYNYPNEFNHLHYHFALHTHWRNLHRRPVNTAISPIVDVQQFALSIWFERFNATKWYHSMNNNNSVLWIYMSPMEWDF